MTTEKKTPRGRPAKVGYQLAALERRTTQLGVENDQLRRTVTMQRIEIEDLEADHKTLREGLSVARKSLEASVKECTDLEKALDAEKRHGAMTDSSIVFGLWLLAIGVWTVAILTW